MEKENLIIKLQKALKLSGFNIRREFSSHLIDQFLEAKIDLNSRPIFQENVNNITKTLGNLCSAGHSIEKEHIERVLEICLHSGYDKNETILNVIGAFDFPKLHYNVDRNIYSINNNEKSKLLAEPSAKSKMFLERYERILQRTKRTILTSNNNALDSEKIHLQTVDYLLTLSEITLEKTLILGSLLQISGGKFLLEDPTGSVELNLIHAKYHTGFYAENSIILVNGYYADKILHASTILMPNGEEYQLSRLTFGNLNYFGGNSKVLLKNSVRLKEHLEKNEKDPFVFLSDVWLDNPETFIRLETLFAQMEEYLPPIAFVFLGNFMERPEINDNIQEFKKLFRKLGKLIKTFNLLCEVSKFIFVPGLEDPCTPNVVPRFALPTFISEEIPNGIFTTNPCRIQYCNKEIVVFRADMLTKFLHSSLHKPQKHDIARSISKTIIGQGHLCPFSLTVFNVFWDFDHCMSLYPLPDLIVLGDKAEPYKDLYKDCLIMNPGQFSANNFTFKVYYPGKNVDNIEEILEDCVVKSDTDEEEIIELN